MVIYIVIKIDIRKHYVSVKKIVIKGYFFHEKEITKILMVIIISDGIKD